MAFPWILIAVFIILVLLAVVAIFITRRKPQDKTGKFPQGYYANKGMSIGMVIGMLIGFIIEIVFQTESFAFPLGFCVGMAAGSIIGMIVEKKNQDKLRPLTEQEQKTKKLSQIISLAALLILVVIVLVFVFVK